MENPNKVVICNRRSICVGGKFYEAGSEIGVVGERSIGMLGDQPDPRKFFYHALYKSEGDAPFAVYSSDGESWQKVSDIDAAKSASGYNDFRKSLEKDNAGKGMGKPKPGKT